MELKEKLRQILKERYGIENDAEIIKEANRNDGNQTGTGSTGRNVGSKEVPTRSGCGI